MQISARNALKGKIVHVDASTTNEAVDSLGLAVGGEAYAVVKASDVMVAVD